MCLLYGATVASSLRKRQVGAIVPSGGHGIRALVRSQGGSGRDMQKADDRA